MLSLCGSPRPSWVAASTPSLPQMFTLNCGKSGYGGQGHGRKPGHRFLPACPRLGGLPSPPASSSWALKKYKISRIAVRRSSGLARVPAVRGPWRAVPKAKAMALAPLSSVSLVSLICSISSSNSKAVFRGCLKAPV